MGLFKKFKETIKLGERLLMDINSLTTHLKQMTNTVTFFTGIAELFAKYIVFDLRMTPQRGMPRQKSELIEIAQHYLQSRKIFWREPF